MVEFKSIKWVALRLFYVYKMLGVVTIPLITFLFIVSTANLLSSGGVTDHNFDVTWALIYAVCFEMNGLKLIVDGRLKQMTGKKGAWVDYILGVFLVSLGVSTTFIEGLVNSGAMTWDDMKGAMWFILAIRSVAILGMIVRECVHYAPLVLSVVAEQELNHEALDKSKSVEADGDTVHSEDTLRTSLPVPSQQNHDQDIKKEINNEVSDAAPKVQAERQEHGKVDDVLGEDEAVHAPAMEIQREGGSNDVVDEQPAISEQPIAINYGDKILAYLRENEIDPGVEGFKLTGAQKTAIAAFAGCSTKTVERKMQNFTAIKRVSNFR